MVKKDSILIIIILIIMISLSIYLYKNKEDNTNKLKIYFFNAGKADAILISKDNKYMMIDTGEEDLSNTILTYFKNNNIKRLEYLIITHFDKDHVGSASSIIDNIEIGNIYQSNYPKESEYYTNYLNSLNNKNITPITVSNDLEISLSDLKININGPDIIYDSNESNNSSLIVSMIYKNNSFLFMGDSENQRIKDFVEINNNTYDFIKIPYHGNYLKRLDDLLENINSKYAVCTCSNSEGCDSRTLELLNNYNIKYYLTRNGSITLLSDGENITFK